MKPLSKILRFIITWFATLFVSVIIVAFIPSDMIDETAMAFIGDFFVLVLPIIAGALAIKDRGIKEEKESSDKKDEIETPQVRRNSTSSRRQIAAAGTGPKSVKNDLKQATLQNKQSAPRTMTLEEIKAFQTPGMRALEAIDEAKIYADQINASTTASLFSSSFKKLIEVMNELIFLNEQEGVSAKNITPRRNLEQITANMEATIRDLICRSIDAIPGYGKEWADKVDQLLNEIEADEFISGYMTHKNRENIAQMRKRAEVVRNSRPTPANTHQLVSSVKEVSRPETIIDIEQIIREENEWRREQQGISLVEAEMRKVDEMDGHTFEQWCAKLLDKSGFTDVDVTRSTGDQGVDVLATLDGVRYAIQCKCYSSNLGNKPVQEVYAGRAIYNCQVGSVMTNRYFTSGAKELAKATDVFLWDRDWIIELLEELEDGELPL